MTLDKKTINKVINLDDKPERRDETIFDAMKNRLLETEEIGDTGFSREIVLPIPMELVKTNLEVKRLIKKAGEISRKPEFRLPCNIETTSIPTSDGGEIKMCNLVFSYSTETDVQRVIQYLDN